MLAFLHEVAEGGDSFNIEGLITLNHVSNLTFYGCFPLLSCFFTLLVTQFCVLYLRWSLPLQFTVKIECLKIIDNIVP